MNNSKSSSGVVFLQRVDKDKLWQAKNLRQQMTESEIKLWEQVKRKKILGLKFRRQQIIEGFIVDFFCHQAKLVAEVDGGVHLSEEQKQIDEHRRNVFALRGLEEIRFRNEEVLNSIDDVVKKITEKVKNRIGMGDIITSPQVPLHLTPPSPTGRGRKCGGKRVVERDF
jgi:very-short-patch-repair endonuclease